MKNTLFTLLLCLISQLGISQVEQKSIFTNGDRILIQLTGDSEYYYNHKIEKGHTIYSLSKIFNVTPDEIYASNRMNAESPLSLGQNLRIPIQSSSLYKGTSLKNISEGHFIPVYYIAKAKDNLYRISKVYFNQPVGDLVSRNNILGNSISVGQSIIIGWLPLNQKTATPSISEQTIEINNQTEAIPSATAAQINSDLEGDMTINTEVDSSVAIVEYPIGFNVSLLGSIKYSNNIKEVKKQQVAHWDNTMADNGTVFALHENAIIDSYIDLYNPLVKRSVRAKVIGRIPYGTYSNEVKLVLSPRAAKQLGARDRRFKVEVKTLVKK